MTKLIRCIAAVSLVATNVVAQTAPPTPADHLTRFVPGLDIEGLINDSFNGAHSGVTSAVAMSTTACNPGSVLGVWEAIPSADHPFICQMYCRLSNGRFEQISDWSYVKHSFASTNSPGCSSGPCMGGVGGNRLGINCSDTYGAGLNSSVNSLGPPWEINGWTGEWVFFGSHLDVGYPTTPPDGQRTSINPTSSVQFKVNIPDAKIGTAGASYYAACYYLHKWEPEANRENNMSSFRINLTNGGASAIDTRVIGPLLEHRYAGARIESAANTVGSVVHDGRFYVGVHVSQNPNGTYHYEYAVHNRDNHGGNAEFRVPVCPTSTFANPGFKDVDLDPSNDWTFSRLGDELVWSAPLGNAQGWNTIFNFWFDSNTGPGDGRVTIYEGTINPGADGTVVVASDVPVQSTLLDLGGGCGVPPARLLANGYATIPNPNLVLTMHGVPSGANVALHVNFDGTSTAIGPPLANPSCELLAPRLSLPTIGVAGVAFWQLPIPNDPNLQGIDLFGQGAIANVGGALLGLADLSNRLRVRIGNGITGCP